MKWKQKFLKIKKQNKLYLSNDWFDELFGNELIVFWIKDALSGREVSDWIVRKVGNYLQILGTSQKTHWPRDCTPATQREQFKSQSESWVVSATSPSAKIWECTMPEKTLVVEWVSIENWYLIQLRWYIKYFENLVAWLIQLVEILSMIKLWNK